MILLTTFSSKYLHAASCDKGPETRINYFKTQQVVTKDMA